MRPIVSCVNSLPEIFSKWVDYWLKKCVTTLVPTYIKDSADLIKALRATFPNGLPTGAKIFSADAVSMYSNIDTDHGISVIDTFLTTHEDQLPPGFPKRLLLASLAEIMRNNIFQFGNTYWRQIRGTAMGTSTAVNYAVLYVALLETQVLLKKYKQNLLFMKRFIDDTIGVWINHDNSTSLEDFLHDLNNFGSLKWTCDDRLVDKLVFLDIEITIDANQQLRFKTFQKDMNLYLYIPPASAHSPNMLKGLIYGRLQSYKNTNSDPDDYIHYAILLAKRLIARGWNEHTITSLMDEAHQSLKRKQLRIDDLTATPKAQPLIFHLPFHPRGIQRQTIQEIYKKTLGSHITDRNFIVAVSRPRNLQERITNTKLKDIQGDNPSDYLDK
jgi:hypothetical protein